MVDPGFPRPGRETSAYYFPKKNFRKMYENEIVLLNLAMDTQYFISQNLPQPHSLISRSLKNSGFVIHNVLLQITWRKGMYFLYETNQQIELY